MSASPRPRGGRASSSSSWSRRASGASTTFSTATAAPRRGPTGSTSRSRVRPTTCVSTAPTRPILCIEGLGVGLGARPFADGVDVIYYIAQENYPVEYVERDFPLRVERYAVRPDSGGPGVQRGGTGVVRDVRVLAERAELATRMENTVVAHYGVAGGGAGRTGRITLNPGTPEERVLPALGDAIILKRGDLLRFETCGGGGWGDPLAREPERERQDVARGFVTPRGALEDYGVVLDEATLEVDKTATQEARARRARDLPLIDRGPGFAQAEERWRAFRSAEASS